MFLLVSLFHLIQYTYFIGLDPAEPDFENHPEGVRIDPTDALFVDIIHTNGAPIRHGGAGLMQVSGHVDFYVNGGERQPGCPDVVTGAVEQLFTRNVSGTEITCVYGISNAERVFTPHRLNQNNIKETHFFRINNVMFLYHRGRSGSVL